MNKNLLIGAGVLVLGYLAYKHFKKPAVVTAPVSPVITSVVDPASGKPMISVTKPMPITETVVK
jgi:hypothetical protein